MQRNRIDLTPSAYMVEETDATKVTKNSVWHTRIYSSDDKLRFASTRNAQRNGRRVIVAQFWNFGQPHYHLSDFTTDDMVQAGRFLSALAKEFWP